MRCGNAQNDLEKLNNKTTFDRLRRYHGKVIENLRNTGWIPSMQLLQKEWTKLMLNAWYLLIQYTEWIVMTEHRNDIYWMHEWIVMLIERLCIERCNIFFLFPLCSIVAAQYAFFFRWKQKIQSLFSRFSDLLVSCTLSENAKNMLYISIPKKQHLPILPNCNANELKKYKDLRFDCRIRSDILIFLVYK